MGETMSLKKVAVLRPKHAAPKRKPAKKTRRPIKH
jgi:hypothetical protein